MQFTKSSDSLDEECLLPESNEKRRFPTRGYRENESWGRFFPYSAALNVVLLMVVVFTAVLQIWSTHRPYIPNEIYCMYLIQA
jgi:hypothetical protein